MLSFECEAHNQWARGAVRSRSHCGQSGKTAIDRGAGNPFGIGRVEKDREGIFLKFNRKDACGCDHFT